MKNYFTRKIHRRVGVLASGWLLMVAITGILLRHSDDLNLVHKKMNWAWALSYYGMPVEPYGLAYNVDETCVVQRGSRVAWGEHLIEGLPRETLCGAFINPLSKLRFGLVYETQIWLLDEDYKPIDKILAVDGLPVPVQKVIGDDKKVYLQSHHQDWSSSWPELERWEHEPNPLPYLEPQAPTFPAILEPEGLDWERVLLDLHSGRLLGLGGAWASDLSALALLYLIFSGWSLYRGKK